MSGERPPFDRVAAALGLAATACLSVALGSTLGPPFDTIGGTGPFAAYFGGLAWWRLRHGSESVPGAEQTTRSLAELEQRVAELEAGQAQLQELEERLDFAERLLTRAAEQERIARGG